MENAAVMVDTTSPPGRLFELYESVPLTRRGNLCREGQQQRGLTHCSITLIRPALNAGYEH